MSLSPELRELQRLDVDLGDVGMVSENRVFIAVSELPIVAKVEPTIHGAFYDADVVLYRDTGLPFRDLLLEVKTSKVGVRNYYRKIREQRSLISDDEARKWMLDHRLVVVVGGLNNISREDIQKNFIRELKVLSKYQQRFKQR